MATGSGKTFTACNFIYRLIKYAGARRVLFLVDRGNLGRQTLKEFQQFVTPGRAAALSPSCTTSSTCNRTSSTPSAKVCITTIQRLFSMLQGRRGLDPELEEAVRLHSWRAFSREPPPVAYNPGIPIETFDFIVTDECHRSIYNLWRQVLEYFDASLIGLTATPSQADLRLLQPEPGHGIQPRAGRGRRRQRRLRRLPHPHPDHRARLDRQTPASSSTSATGRRARCAGKSSTTTSPTTPTSSTATWSPRTRSAPSSAPSGTSCSPRSFPAAPRCPRR